MTKVLFVCNNLSYGGIPRALVNLLKELEGAADISLLLFDPAGEYQSEIPDYVELLPSAGKLPLLGVTQKELKKRSKRQALLRAFYVMISRIAGNGWARRRVFASFENYGPFDIAVSYAQDNSEKAFAVGCNDFVLNKVNASKKVACVHCDFEHYGGNTEKNRRPYYSFDRIVCVSDGCRDAFVRQCPKLSERTLSIENCTDYKSIVSLAKKKIPPLPVPEDAFIMVTAARIYPEKGIGRAIRAAKSALLDNPKVYWVIVGDGTELEACRQLAAKERLSDRIIFAGKKRNPYPYIAAASLFFLPSVHEAAPMVFEEACALSVPVLTTDTTSARQMVKERGIGFVCENSESGIEAALKDILSDTDRLGDIRANMATLSRDNLRVREKWTKLFKELQ